MANKISFILDFIENKAINSIAKVQNAFDKVNSSIGKTNDKIKFLPKSISQLENELDRLKTAQKNAFTVQGIKHYSREIDKVEREIKKLNKTASTGGLRKFGGNMFDAMPMGIGSLINPATLTVAAIGLLGSQVISATKKAAQFEQGMAKANATLQLSKGQLAGVRNELLMLGATGTTDLNQIPDAFNKIVSGLGDVPDAVGLGKDVLEKALKASEAGFTDISVVADAFVNVLNSVGTANTNVSEVSDVLFATLNKGKGEFGDIANYLPQLIPMSNALGISFKETAGAYAMLTASGLKSEAASTGLKNFYKVLGDTKTQERFQKNGINIFNKDGSIRDLTEIVNSVNTRLSKYKTDEKRTNFLDSLGLDMEASLALNLMAQNADKLGNSIKYIEQSAGEMNRTLKKTENPLSKFQKVMNITQVKLTLFGYSLLSVFEKSMDAIIKANEVSIVDKTNKEIDTIKRLQIELSVANTTEERRREILQQLESINPKITEGVTAESLEYEKLSKNIEAVIQSLKNKIAFEKISQKYAGQYAEYEDVTENLTAKKDEAFELLKNSGYYASVTANAGKKDLQQFLKEASTDLYAKMEKGELPTERALTAKSYYAGSGATTIDIASPYKLAADKMSKLITEIGGLTEQQTKTEQLAKKIENEKNVLAKLFGIEETKNEKNGKNGKNGKNEKTERTSDENGTITEGITAITGGGSLQKNITINVSKFLDDINLYSQNLKEGADEVERTVLDMFIRVVNSANAY